MASMKFKEALFKTNYNQNIHGLLRNIIMENYKYTGGKCQIFLVTNKENIFVIKHQLIVPYQNSSLIVNLLLYFPLDFPREIPRLFFLNLKGVFIQKSYIQRSIVDDTTMEIFYNMFQNFEYIPFENRISDLFDRLKREFTKDFPLCKDENKDNNYIGPCKFDEKNSRKIDFIEEFSFLNDLDNRRTKVKNEVIKIYDDVSLSLQITNSELLEMDKKLDDETILNAPGTDATSINFRNIRDQLQAMKMSLSQEMEDIKMINEGNIIENIDKLVFIKNKEKYKFTVMEKTEEEFLGYLKRGFEKKIVSFEDLIANTRNSSREIFYLKYLQSKNDN